MVSFRFEEHNQSESITVPKVTTRHCRKYSKKDIQNITERMVTPPPSPSCRRRCQAVNKLTVIEKFGVPPHLWGRQKPADKQLIERLVKPTTSHSQRRALTLKQYKQ